MTYRNNKLRVQWKGYSNATVISSENSFSSFRFPEPKSAHLKVFPLAFCRRRDCVMTPSTAEFRVEFDQVNRISLIRVEAPLTEESLGRLYEANQEHCSANGARVAIVDLSSVSEFAVSSGFVRCLADRKPAKAAFGCLCFIVGPAGYAYGLCRMFQLWGESRRPLLQVVHTLGEAFAAIGIRSPFFEPSVVRHYSGPNNPAPLSSEQLRS